YSRFAKIGGEMISLGSVEEKLSQVFDEETQFVAVAVSDDKKGESIVLLIKSAFSLDEINERIKGLNVPPIMLPSQVFLVDEIPMLGSGKVDFKGAKNLAMSLVK
ncbi:MAG: 2-acyl-glycerophospho-ethanolamine acyltransferase, partial [Haemophilus parainfluenzae]|nr:2-acyl-glycerophospho-ethanolamine acyltransferase [Haemophilus parainfluenzae]